MPIKKSVEDIDVAGKTILLRVDFNVPFRPGTTEVADDARIRASLPTIRHLIGRGCRVVVCSHLGRPEGRVVESLRMAPAAARLSDLLDSHVGTVADCVGPEVEAAVEALAPSGILVLENLRFHAEEEANEPLFSRSLASAGQIFVDDAFGAAHRAHASTVGVTRHLPAVAGLLMASELSMLDGALSSPERPFAAILGGAKVSDKLAALSNLARMVDTLIVGGGMAATFLKARGWETGASPVEAEMVSDAEALMDRARGDGGLDLLLPEDVVAADDFAKDAAHRVVDAAEIPEGARIMDIGPRSSASFTAALTRARTVVWNGPMGVFEWPAFAHGTEAVASSLADMTDAVKVIGGGSTAEAVIGLGLADKMTHVSTGGGASLALLEGKPLPGVAALLDREDEGSRPAARGMDSGSGPE